MFLLCSNIDSLFLQNVDYKYDESIINPDYQVKLPDKKSQSKTETQETQPKPCAYWR